MPKAKCPAETPEATTAPAEARTIDPADIPALRAAKLETVNEVVTLLARGELHEGDARLDAALVWADFPDRLKLAQMIIDADADVEKNESQREAVAKRLVSVNEDSRLAREAKDRAEAEFKSADEAARNALGVASSVFSQQQRLDTIISESRLTLAGMRRALGQSPLSPKVVGHLNPGDGHRAEVEQILSELARARPDLFAGDA